MPHPKLAGRVVPPLIVMGVSGSGKSTIGSRLAESLQLPYVDGDRLHSAGSVEKMSGGGALDDEDRLPWLQRVGEVLRQHQQEKSSVVVACSALKRNYRDLLQEFAPGTVYVHLDGGSDVLAARLSQREHEYMPPGLLQSQLDALEPLGRDEPSIVVDIDQEPEEIVREIEQELVTLIEQDNPVSPH